MPKESHRRSKAVSCQWSPRHEGTSVHIQSFSALPASSFLQSNCRISPPARCFLKMVSYRSIANHNVSIGCIVRRAVVHSGHGEQVCEFEVNYTVRAGARCKR